MKLLILFFLFTSFVFADDKFCEELEIGQSFSINVPSLLSKTKVLQRYSLKRSAEDIFDVYINPKIKKSKIFDQDEEFWKIFKDNMEACYRSVDGKLVDEFGRQIRLHVYNPETDDVPRPKGIRIKLMNSHFRSNSMAYRSSIQCPTMIHEAFHLLGLPDEYVERETAWNNHFLRLPFKPFIKAGENISPAYDCRAIGPANSIMHGYGSIHQGEGLYSGHVNAILYPRCKERNRKFFKCAKYAYRTSFENNGALPDLSNCASRVPDYCKNPDWVKINQ